jgi:hypothetical protein
MPLKFTATAPDGTTFTRTSASKRYTHAVLAIAKDSAKWQALAYAGSPDLARRRAQEPWLSRTFQQVAIVAVTAEDVSPKTRLDDRTRKIRNSKRSITKLEQAIQQYQQYLAEGRPGVNWQQAIDRRRELIAGLQEGLAELEGGGA